MRLKAIFWLTAICLTQTLSGQNNSDPATGEPLPTIIAFSGTIKGMDRNPMSGNQTLTFSFYDAQAGGSPLYTDSQTVDVDAVGHYTVYFGIGDGDGDMSVRLFISGQTRWIGVTPSDGVERTRVPIATVPYAFKAADSARFGGKSPEDFVSVEQLAALFANPSSLRGGSSPNLPASGINVSNENINAGLFNGFPESAFAKIAAPNIFQGLQTFSVGAVFSASSPDAALPNSFDSAPLDLESSLVQVRTGSVSRQTFRWVSLPMLSPSGLPTARLELRFGQNSAMPQPTGLSINADGTINFAADQVLPSSAVMNAITNAQSGEGADGGGASGNPTVNTAQYSWTETPSGKAIKVGSNTITLMPCPKGVNGTDLWHYLYISKTGTPESVLIAGGSCVSGARKGTIIFTAQYNHPKGYSIGSATDGVEEATIAAAPVGKQGQLSRNIVLDPGNHVFHARLSVRATGVTITASGATITCEMQDTCIMLGDPANAIDFQQITLNGFRVIAGVQNGIWPAIEDNANGSEIAYLAPMNAIVAGGSFGSLIQIDNDQAATVSNFTVIGNGWSRCDASFCSTAITGPGTKGNSGVLWVQNSNLSLNCTANGIDNQDANTLSLKDVVVQAYPQFGVRGTSTYSNNPSVSLNNVYEEIGNCQNPRGTGMAGVIVEGGRASSTGGVGPAGQLPVFAKTGTTQYNYSIVVNSSTAGPSPAYLAGYAYTNQTGSINVVWNQVGNTGVVSYDVLRTSGPTTGAPYGTGPFAVATGIPATTCANSLCSFVDDAARPPASYTVSTNTPYWPALKMWPGSVILTTAYDYVNTGGGAPTVYNTDTLYTGAGIVNSAGAFAPSVFANQCNSETPMSSIWIQCLGGNAQSNDNPAVTATVLQSTGNAGNLGGLKGRLIFEMPANSSVAATEILTLQDSNPTKTMATPNNRPSWDANDVFLGFDNSANSPAEAGTAQLSIGSPKSISNYIGNTGDNVSWGERLTKTSKTFQVPVVANSNVMVNGNLNINGSCTGAGCGPFSPSGTQATDNFNLPNGPLDPNWTVTAGTWSIQNDQASFVGEGSDLTALAAYTAASFSNNQTATIQVIFPENSATAAGPAVRMDSNSETAYACFATPAQTFIVKYDQGVRTGVGGTGPGLPSGDYLTAQVTGTSPAYISCLDNGVPIPGVSGTDASSPLTSGYPGIFGQYYILDTYLDNFRASNLSFSTNGSISVEGGLQSIPLPVASIPACTATVEGTFQAMNNASSNSLGAVIANTPGPYHVLAYCDGNNWIVGIAAQ